MIPVKGPRPYFDEALRSLLSQGMGDDLEIIVQDADVRSGGVGELNHEIHERHENGRGVRGQELAVNDGGLEGVRWFCEADKGQSDALNKGFAKAKGEWLFWLNADDVLLPGALKAVRRVTAREGVRWIAGGSRYIDENGCQVDVRQDRRWHGFMYRHMPIWTCGPSSFFSRDLLRESGGLDRSLKFVMDIDLWQKFQLSGARYVMLPELLWGFRVHPGSLTLSGANAEERHKEWEKLLARYGFRHYWFFRWMSRMVRLLDGCQVLIWWEKFRSMGLKVA